MHVSLKGK